MIEQALDLFISNHVNRLNASKEYKTAYLDALLDFKKYWIRLMEE